MSARKFVFGDEALAGGGDRAKAILKTLISEETINVTPKGIDSRKESNVIGLIMASNAKWVVPAGVSSRRFTVFDVSPKYHRQDDYFRRLSKIREKGPLQRLLAYFLSLDLSEWKNPQKWLPTDALLEQKELSLSSMDKWLHDTLHSGEILPDVIWKRTSRGMWVSTKDLVESCLAHSDAFKTRSQHGSEIIILNHVHKVFGAFGQEGKLRIERPRNKDGSRGRRMYLPALLRARELWDVRFGQETDWSD